MSLAATQERATERDRIRAELERRRALRAAEALTDVHAVQRRAEREAEAEIRRDGRIIAASAAERRMMREQTVARRRDAITRAMAYPMSGDELIAACQHSTLAARVPAEAFDDVSQALAAHVIRRHGPTPLRVKVSAAWLIRRALAIHIDQRRADERATGARAAAEQLADWRASDHRAAMRDAASAGDRVWALAAHRPAPTITRPLSAASIAARLDISPRQSEALALAIETRHARPLTSTERVQWLNARRAILKHIPTVEALLIAIRPERYAAELLADAAIRAERQRAATASRGGCCVPGSVRPASALPLSRMSPERPAVSVSRPPMIGEVITRHYGDGYAGACSVLYLYRGRRTPRFVS